MNSPIRPNPSHSNSSSSTSSSSTSKLTRGYQVEDLARSYLEMHGLQFLEARFRVRVGEIDLIFLEGRELVFVEVRSRVNGRNFESARESVNGKKLRRIRLTIEIYLQRRPREMARLRVSSIRFDVLGFDGENWEWWKNQELV